MLVHLLSELIVRILDLDDCNICAHLVSKPTQYVARTHSFIKNAFAYYL
jgi:hypothetical protein